MSFDKGVFRTLTVDRGATINFERRSSQEYARYSIYTITLNGELIGRLEYAPCHGWSAYLGESDQPWAAQYYLADLKREVNKLVRHGGHKAGVEVQRGVYLRMKALDQFLRPLQVAESLLPDGVFEKVRTAYEAIAEALDLARTAWPCTAKRAEGEISEGKIFESRLVVNKQKKMDK